MTNPSANNDMDEAAAQAKADLLATVPAEMIAAVGQWWDRHYLKAGHKRLARILLEIE